MDTSEHTTDPVLQDWYRYAARQPWAVASYLRLVRLHEFKTWEQQCNEFGVSTDNFLRLHAMPLPRDEAFAMDALGLAQECHVEHSGVFVQAMLLGRQLASSPETDSNEEQYYEAAFDPVDGLDTPSEQEEEL
jgi:hypothetical protein